MHIKEYDIIDSKKQTINNILLQYSFISLSIEFLGKQTNAYLIPVLYINNLSHSKKHLVTTQTFSFGV